MRNQLACIVMGLVLISGCGHFSDQSRRKADGVVMDRPQIPQTEITTHPAPAPIEPLPPIELASAKEQPDKLNNDLPNGLSIQNETDESATDASPDETGMDTLTQGNDPASGEITKRTKGQQMLDEALEFCDVAQSFWQNGELDSSLEALDKAYSLIIEVDTVEDEKLFQQKEDLRFLISKRILEIYASRNVIVNGDHDEIPMESNQHILAEIQRFTTGPEKTFFQEAYQRSGMYRPYIVQALKKAGLPEELSWLPLIESGFKTKALSSARALGLWQFIPSTGYKFGLKRDRYIDERMDFIKSTHAAIAYLQELHNIFGDWATVLAAYNCGEGRVLQVIRTQNINYLDNFWDLYGKLPSETARYVPRFFATLQVIKNLEQYGYQDLQLDPGIEFDTMPVERELQLKDIAAATSIDLDQLKLLNPELRYHIIPPDGYELKIPRGQSQIGLAETLAAIPTATLPQQTIVWHTVRSGDNLSAIARKYRTSVQKIMQANSMRGSHFLRVGSRLKIPGSGYVPERAAADRSNLPANVTHIVSNGDSLWRIAQKYGVTVKHIQSLNGLTSNNLSVGQHLLITRSATAPPPDTSEAKNYKVRQGDTPYTIAQRLNMPLDRLMTINQLTPRSRIYPGQQLCIE